ncbi:sodium- and chloride-dependent taurine transporter-like isoform X1 [Ostrea edulis]|uniref:sodium- and chloride-dependent taurine transporter-like isoform X1 n=2 Tax=Ostrea edulis TaxID=37623 RepID=UPI0020946BFE|nr:sodium- and chloride-dependent taurine transporter-like isoform X1 [Ostrea edulis]XP_048750541.1 sodium- and chloride-dependent taurine transporter-like isoform X1 [Ostrea edulis]
MDEEKNSPAEKNDREVLTVSEDKHKRVFWSGKVDFVLACIGNAVGLGNIWRFPYLCYKNGGGAFLIPYFIMIVCGGLPIMLLEFGLGQYMSRGGLKCWVICPLFQGIGISTLVIVFLCSCYYVVILAWGLYYLYMSMSSILPWSVCTNEWNTDRCALSSQELSTRLCLGNSSLNSTMSIGKLKENLIQGDVTLHSVNQGLSTANCSVRNLYPVDPAVEFWENQVIQISSGIEDVGGIVPHLAICLLVMWVIVYFCVWRGVKWTGKVVYFTATFPYLILLILLVRGVTLPGAAKGIEYFLKPDFTRLKDAQVWMDGGSQVFFSAAVAIGAMITLGSYNMFNTDFYKCTLVVAAVNSGTSILGGFVVFSVLGFMAHQQNVDIDQVAESGPGLVFIVYPKAISQMPLPQFWSILFFFMLFLIGIDSLFVMTESAMGHVSDMFPRLFYKVKGRMILSAVACVIWFTIGLSMVSRGGMYVFQLFDYYSASGMVLLWVCFWEAIVIGWIFGADKFCDAIELMIGYRIPRLFHYCWRYITPVVTAGIFAFQVVTFKPLKYNNVLDYPPWAQCFGLMLALVSMCCIPVYVIFKLLFLKGSFIERLKESIKPHLTRKQLCKEWMIRDESFLLQQNHF